MSRRIPTLLGAAALAATFAIVVPTVNSAAALRPKKVVVFGIDGLLFDKIAPDHACAPR